MRLIAILLSLWLNRYPERVEPWRRRLDFNAFADSVARRLGSQAFWAGPWSLLALLALPVGGVLLVQWLLGDWLLGLVWLALSVAALLFAYGSTQIDSLLEAYLSGWRNQQLAEMRAAAEALAEEDELPADHAELTALAVHGVFWQGYQRLYGVLFWFLLLGPVGAVLFRLVTLSKLWARRQGHVELERAAVAVSQVLDWLPARAAALSFALAGSMVPALGGWTSARDELDAGSRCLLVRSGLGALDLPLEGGVEPAQAEKVLREARDLVGRSLMVWLAVVALLTIAGWTY